MRITEYTLTAKPKSNFLPCVMKVAFRGRVNHWGYLTRNEDIYKTDWYGGEKLRLARECVGYIREVVYGADNLRNRV